MQATAGQIVALAAAKHAAFSYMPGVSTRGWERSGAALAALTAAGQAAAAPVNNASHDL